MLDSPPANKKSTSKYPRKGWLACRPLFARLQIRTKLQSSELRDVNLWHCAWKTRRLLRLPRINKTTLGHQGGAQHCTSWQHLVQQVPGWTKQIVMHLTIYPSIPKKRITLNNLWHTLLTQNPVQNVFCSKDTNMGWRSNYIFTLALHLLRRWKLSHHHDESKVVILSKKRLHNNEMEKETQNHTLPPFSWRRIG